MSGKVKKLAEVAFKAGTSIDWEGMAKLIVSDELARSSLHSAIPSMKLTTLSRPSSVRPVSNVEVRRSKSTLTCFLRLEPTKGSYAKDWAKWEKQLREILFVNTYYLNSIQVPFESAVELVLEQLRTIVQGDYTTPSTKKRKFGNHVFATVNLLVSEIQSLLDKYKMATLEASLDGDKVSLKTSGLM